MLVLSTLHRLLSQILTLPDLHTAVLLTTEGQLVSVASDPSRSKDDILVAVGLSGEIWQETQEQGYGMVDSEVSVYVFFVLETARLTIPPGGPARSSLGITRQRNPGTRAETRRPATTHATRFEFNRGSRMGRIAREGETPYSFFFPAKICLPPCNVRERHWLPIWQNSSVSSANI
jgi:hypothetical protein